jgi:hypothetical protein
VIGELGDGDRRLWCAAASKPWCGPWIRTPARGSTRWPTVLLIVGAGVVSAFQVGKAPPALAVQADLGLDLAATSWLLSAFAIVGALAGIAIGVAVESVRRVLQVSHGSAYLRAPAPSGRHKLPAGCLPGEQNCGSSTFQVDLRMSGSGAPSR